MNKSKVAEIMGLLRQFFYDARDYGRYEVEEHGPEYEKMAVSANALQLACDTGSTPKRTLNRYLATVTDWAISAGDEGDNTFPTELFDEIEEYLNECEA